MKRILFYSCLCLAATFSACDSETSRSDKSVTEIASDSLAAVQEETQRKTDQPAGDTTSFKVAFQHFFRALQAHDTVALNQFIHPDQGLWVVEQPGAVPAFTHVTQIQNFKRHFQQKSFFTINQELTKCELQQAPFPKFDCGERDQGRSGYSRDGCFFWDADRFKESNMWNYAGLNKEQLQQIKQTLPLLRHSVLHTTTNFKFHFGFDKSRWYLLFAELIYPCSA